MNGVDFLDDNDDDAKEERKTDMYYFWQAWKAASLTFSTRRCLLKSVRCRGCPTMMLTLLRARSHVTTALASQATAEDDVELRAQWEALAVGAMIDLDFTLS